jgi:hypothetical protein
VAVSTNRLPLTGQVALNESLFARIAGYRLVVKKKQNFMPRQGLLPINLEIIDETGINERPILTIQFLP